MDNPFKFLREPEWATLKASAKQQDFAEGEVLLAAGTKPRGISVVVSGTVAVRRDLAGFDITIAEIEPGAIFGEMSFIESMPAEVSLVALTDVKTLFIDHAQVQTIIRDNPAFYGRFFQSLAYILSRRLRELSSAVGKQPADDWINEGD